MTSLDTARRAGGRPFTGRAFLLILVLGFGAVFAVNFTMAYLAIKSFNGVETESSYAAGLHFTADMTAIKTQDARKWQVEAHVGTLDGAGGVDVTAQFRDAAAAPIKGLTVSATLEHPTNLYLDRTITLAARGDGAFAGRITGITRGAWVLRLAASGQNGELLFNSRNHVTLAP